MVIKLAFRLTYLWQNLIRTMMPDDVPFLGVVGFG